MIVAEKQGSTLTKAYVYLDGKLVAQYSNSTTYFAHEDHLGSTRLVTRLDRSTEECDDYYPYGELVPCGNTSTLSHKFTGKERDTETGLDDFDVRYFGSSLGRFLSPDPLFGRPGRPQTLNRYAYVLNNPLRFIDPTGLVPQEASVTVSPTGSCDTVQGGNATVPKCTKPTPPTRQNETSNDQMQKANDPTQNPQPQKPEYQEPDRNNPREVELTNIVYNETSRLRVDPNAKPGAPGSAEDLQNARVAIAEIANRVIEGGHPERIVARPDLSSQQVRSINGGNADAIAAHNASLAAARQALAGSNTTNGATQYRTRFGRDVSTPIGSSRGHRGTPVSQHFGPFPIANRRREVVVVAP